MTPAMTLAAPRTRGAPTSPRRSTLPGIGVVGLLVVAVLLALPVQAVPRTDLGWATVDNPVAGSIRALDAVSADVAWAASDDGEVVRTTDGGSTWSAVAPPDSEDLLFRDIEAFDARRAVLLAIGEGDASRILRTDDGGATWQETFRNPEPAAFYNCMAFWTRRHGIVVGDTIDGVFRVLTTSDGGRTWTRVPDDALPPASGEFGFSASGTCVAVAGGHDAWFGTGGAAARVFHTDDRGQSFEVSDTPLRATDAGGVFTLAFRTPRYGVALGGDFLAPDVAVDAAATTRDGGDTWLPADADATPTGYRSGSAWVTGLPHTVVAVGPNGSDVSSDGGTRWRRFSDVGWHAVECARDGSCWAAGSGGRIGVLVGG